MPSISISSSNLGSVIASNGSITNLIYSHAPWAGSRPPQVFTLEDQGPPRRVLFSLDLATACRAIPAFPESIHQSTLIAEQSIPFISLVATSVPPGATFQLDYV
jgi:hypothetical protein